MSEETAAHSGAIAEIGGKPIMKIFSNHGVNDLVICLGFRGASIEGVFLAMKQFGRLIR